MTKTEVVTRGQGIAVIGLAMLLAEGIWKTLGILARKAVGQFKWDLMSHP